MSLINQTSRSNTSLKPSSRRAETSRVYAHPLPIIFPEPTYKFLGLSLTRPLNPHCTALFDPLTRSAWVPSSGDATLLWQRGFFGKGDLSRSEPSWLARQINARKMKGKALTSEEITAKRRAERKQFKLDRAKAIAAAAAEAETAFNEQGRVIAPGIAPDGTRIIPSAATWKPSSAPMPSEKSPLDVAPDEEEEMEPIQDLEHLQLSLQEAFFLVWALDCLTILHPQTNVSFTLAEIWNTFQNSHIPSLVPQPNAPSPSRFDNPFLVSYVAYHHYRSLGWVVKCGIKFCVDYLLYKRGPVFQHAEFAIVVIPVYEDPEDQATSPFKLQNAEPFTWSWLSTINRVNSQVQKTLVLSYITIPAESRVSPKVLSSPACFAHYSVREVVLRRFIPARMRD
ncbi:uncharacterized protein F5891DRAFT_1006992 [Suillus fuscotomentosus]|uniref:tRNA-splicing endonuclease subunit Sen2 n=1 Tax=Suillus fuscotomentosus TaxID=1912939 RepID=A0AAD4HRH3_9AGAM|nr:uncharacterized protein F5891DRAFT_1006992 [Suillus fuscotomentosus]KAG1905876.1 hypothetical protein F5891DRAFT_1006992 [Suillus fuscotomentosus]